MSTNAPENVATRTIVSHSNVRDNLLQHSLSLRELLVLRLCSLEFLAELLDARYGELCAAQGEKHALGARTCIFPRWKNLASWLILRVSPRSDQAEVACGGPNRTPSPRPHGSHPRTPRTRLSRLVQILFCQCLFKVSKIAYAHPQRLICAACHRTCRTRAHISPQQQPAPACALLAARRRSTSLLSSS